MRILALDLGEKTCGICISDELNMIALPLENYKFKSYDSNSPVKKIKTILDSYEDIDLILIGYPTKTDGSRATITDFIDEIIAKLKNVTLIKLKKVDERYSTQRGIAILENSIKDKNKLKELKDVAAAYVLLTDYLSLV